MRIAPPDLAFYYAYAHSLLYNIDFCFAEQYDRFPFAYHELYLTAEGLPANDWPMGTGVLWLPFLSIAWLARGVFGIVGFDIPPGGTAWFDQWVITYGATLLYSVGALLLSYRICLRLGIDRKSAIWACALIAAGSSYTYHLIVNSADSHPPSAFFLALFLLLWLRSRENGLAITALAAGICLGVAGLVRPHNLLFILTPLLMIVLERFHPTAQSISSAHRSLPKSIIPVGFIAVGAGIAYLPQLLVWKTLYGSWLALPRSGDVHWLNPHLYDMLFSDFHGLVSWSPLFGLALVGLCLERRWLPYAIPMALTLYINSCNIAWWAGGSFGNRRIVSCAPFLILGLAICFHVMPKVWLKGAAMLAAAWTLLLLFAEVGETIRLGHYMSWSDILAGIPAGAPQGLINLFERANWSEQGWERALGVVTVWIALIGGWWVWRLLADHKRRAAAALAAIVALNLLCAAAALRTPGAARIADLDEYSPLDRFTWVVYYEKGFYHLQRREHLEALEVLVAALMLEPRHPQPWMYAGFVCDLRGWPNLAYLYYRQAVVYGGRMDTLLDRYLIAINRRIREGGATEAGYFNERGVLYGLLGDYHLAESDFRQALQLDPNQPHAGRNLESIEKRRRGERAPFYSD